MGMEFCWGMRKALGWQLCKFPCSFDLAAFVILDELFSSVDSLYIHCCTPDYIHWRCRLSAGRAQLMHRQSSPATKPLRKTFSKLSFYVFAFTCTLRNYCKSLSATWTRYFQRKQKLGFFNTTTASCEILFSECSSALKPRNNYEYKTARANRFYM